MSFVIEGTTTGDGLQGSLGASCSGSVLSVPVVSVSTSVVLRGAKKLQVNTDFGSILRAADVGTGLVYLWLSARCY
jgi:hypothetical protein